MSFISKSRVPVCLALLTLAGLVQAGVPTLPSINTANLFNVTNAAYGAATNNADNATAINAAITAASTASAGVGGGTVEIPGPGVYLCGPLTMKSKVNLQIDAGATLRMLPYATWTNNWGNSTYFLTASSRSDVELSGSGGIDGQGGPWWANAQNNSPYLLYFGGCNRVLIQSLTISNSPSQNIVFKNSSSGNITVQGISIFAPSSHASTPSHNTDGVDLAGTNCLVQNCVISTGDDNIAVGSSATASANIVVTNCLFGVGHGMTIGSNTEGGVSNLTVVNCSFTNTDYGIRMKTDNRSSGGGGQGGVDRHAALECDLVGWRDSERGDGQSGCARREPEPDHNIHGDGVERRVRLFGRDSERQRDCEGMDSTAVWNHLGAIHCA